MKKGTEFECPNCGAQGTYDKQKRMCVSKHADLKEKILDGSYFEWECTACNKRFFIEDVFLYNDDQHKFMVYFVPGYDKSVQRIPTLLKTKAEYDTDNSTLRITANFVDFIEKIRILEAGLDDRVIETIKAMYAQSHSQRHNQKIYNMVFENKDDLDNLTFAVFLENDEYTIDIPQKAYQKALTDFTPFFQEPEERVFLMVDQSWFVDMLQNS